jgi:hypothetical protein
LQYVILIAPHMASFPEISMPAIGNAYDKAARPRLKKVVLQNLMGTLNRRPTDLRTPSDRQ